jgi:hypothetical protein
MGRLALRAAPGTAHPPWSSLQWSSERYQHTDRRFAPSGPAKLTFRVRPDRPKSV